MKNLKILINLVAILISMIGFAKSENDSILTNYRELELDCDACGCAATSTANGIENLMNASFIGVRYLNQFYKAKENAFSNELNQKQTFNTIQLYARIPVHNKIDVSVSLPYHIHQKEGLNTTKINGFGDINVMGIVKIIEAKETKNQFKHALTTAIGVKAPIAKFNQQNAETTNPSFQLGTGSWDTQLGLNYQISYKKTAIQLVTDYNLKGENKYNYKFGNQWNQLIQIQQLLVDKKYKLAGKVAFQNELFEQNKQFGEKIPKTKGNLQTLKFGLEAAVEKINFGIEYYQPLHTDLNNGEIELKNRVGVFINYNIF